MNPSSEIKNTFYFLQNNGRLRNGKREKKNRLEGVININNLSKRFKVKMSDSADTTTLAVSLKAYYNITEWERVYRGKP